MSIPEADRPGVDGVVVREGALVCATLLGDRSAKRDLLEAYDETVDENERWWKAFHQRGEVHVRIRDWSAAAKDLKEAIELLGDRARESTHQDLWIDLARAHTQGGKLGKARDTLEDMGLTAAVIEKLKRDPDFSPLVDHPTYGRAFQ